MLPARHRMRRSAEFSAAVRAGARARRGVLVVHQQPTSASIASAPPGGAEPARIGLVVGRSVGNSVHRHQVSRRLRAQLALRLDRFPAGSATVVRALPGAAGQSSAALGADLDGALHRLRGRSR